MIKEYISSISKRKEFSKVTFDDKTIYRFVGDGCGDFEEVFNSATVEAVKSYIDYCKDQIKIAEEYLEFIKENKN
jgi:hypothetical protein